MSAPHPVVLRASTAVPPKHRPPPPFHLGGATPRLGHLEYLALSVFAVSHVTAHLTPDERAAVQGQLTLAQSVLDAGSFTDAHFARYTQLKRRLIDPRLTFASRFLEAIKDTLWTTLKVGRPALYRDSAKLVATHEGAAAAATFVRGLDDELCRLDAVSMLERVRVTPSSPVRSVLARGAENDKTSALVLRLASEQFGLLWRPAGPWAWLEGTRDDVFAVVPSDLFETAAQRALVE